MKIAVTSQDGKGDFEIPKFGPWRAFFSVLTDNKHKLVGLEESPELIIFMNNHPKLLKKAQREFKDAWKILILWESAITWPQNFLSRDLSLFDFVFSPSKMWIQGQNVKYFNWPQCHSSTASITYEEWKKRSDVPVVFQANKFSFIKGEQYSLRRKIVSEFGVNLNLYGKGWNNVAITLINLVRALLLGAKHWRVFQLIRPYSIWIFARSYKGFKYGNKDVLKGVKFSIVIENNLEYVSEKIFESISHGCVVIYCGPNLSNFGIPSNIVFSCAPSSSQVLQAYRYLRDNEEQAFKIAETAVTFQKSDSFRKFYNETVFEKLALEVLEEVELSED